MPGESFSVDPFQLEAQEVLDDLHERHLISFKLTAFKVEFVGYDKYIIYFHDSRFPDLTVSWIRGESFRDAFRTAILDRLSGTNQ